MTDGIERIAVGDSATLYALLTTLVLVIIFLGEFLCILRCGTCDDDYVTAVNNFLTDLHVAVSSFSPLTLISGVECIIASKLKKF